MTDEEKEAEPYQLYDVKVMDINYIEKEALEAANACVFKGNFQDEGQKTDFSSRTTSLILQVTRGQGKSKDI